MTRRARPLGVSFFFASTICKAGVHMHMTTALPGRVLPDAPFGGYKQSGRNLIERESYPLSSMYGIFTYIYHQFTMKK